ncbi:dephospho-CoA kinase [Fusibacter tunisiensis]|uniref:Dephospho-CoA kinase n=1 Tax=Fusibacter tunisiensis TaxID=1008308 RepID=A0ABS2MMZ2_9FIRM|nr:dephospho-CoA kinase [Fusibacter tunisiensis]MBM7560775.1 dephospho-CoA kinase [Fusibacter tunisiensis]
MMPSKTNWVIGITGSIGSGKSTAVTYLIDLGYPVVDADRIAREIVEPGEETYNKIIRAFGTEVLEETGVIDRKFLGRLIFNDPEKRKILNAITHPAIFRCVQDQIRVHMKNNRIVFADIPLLIESNRMSDFDEVWLIYAPEPMLAQRVMSRDQVTQDEAMARIKAQMSIEQKRRLADTIIQNTKGKQELYSNIDKELSRLKSHLNVDK